MIRLVRAVLAAFGRAMVHFDAAGRPLPSRSERRRR